MFKTHKVKDGGDPARLLLIAGEFWTNYAWDARTSEWSNKVSQEGWSLFEKRLPFAAEALEAAWKLDQGDPNIAIVMMQVELGQGKGRDRLETWFRRAMDADPDSYCACAQKLLYLEPKWYGEPEDVIQFGYKCLATNNWASRIPFILLDGHTRLAKQMDDPKAYWKIPDVWSDIQKLYEACLKANPNSKGDLSCYAMYAYRAEQWKLANELFTKVGDNPDLQMMKCTMAEYQNMRQRATEEAEALPK